MTKTEVAEKVSKRTGIEKNDILFIIQEMLNVIKEELISGGQVTFLNFGKFILRTRPGKMARNIVEGTPVWVEPFKYIYFKASDGWKKEVREKNKINDEGKNS